MTRLNLVVIAVVIAMGGSAAAQNADPEAPVDRVDVGPDAYLQGAEALFARLEDASPILKDIAQGAIRRARRKVSIGPSVGVFGGYADGVDAAVSFGIGIETFKIPVLPSV